LSWLLRATQLFVGARQPWGHGEALAALAAVDFVVLFEESSPREFLDRLAPDIVVDGSETAREGRGERSKAAHWKFVYIPPEPGYSTAGLLARISRLPE
jgi:D-beta-D-heptose 7-phosphate kinase/D-beta-D-heptose 1-phosphate adenosyltransferase